MIIVPPMFTVPNGLNVVPSPLNRRPCIMAFGTKFPPKFSYPSKVHRYKPLSMCTLQARASASARAVGDVPTAIAAIRLANAHANRKQLVMLLINFVFISIISFLISFSCFSLSASQGQEWGASARSVYWTLVLLNFSVMLSRSRQNGTNHFLLCRRSAT